MKTLRFGILGTGFWSRFQLAGWRELEGVECVALYNRTRAKAEALGAEFGISEVFDDAEALLDSRPLDFVDIITDPATHPHFVRLAAERGVPVICQKPLAPTLEEATNMASACREAGVPLLVHENWRWQRPIREVRAALDSGSVGKVFRARIQYSCSFPVFDNQPFLKDVSRFILSDMGPHILDCARFLFGEAERLYAHTSRVRPGIAGEDVATVLLSMESGAVVTCEISYASRLEHERFPDTYLLVEGDRGSLELGPGYWLRTTTQGGTLSRRVPPPRYAWADPAYDVVHSSIVACNANLLGALRGDTRAETTAEDNLRTLGLVEAAYRSAEQGVVVSLPLPEGGG